MLWFLARAAGFLALVGGVGLVATLLAGQDGRTRLVWNDWIIETEIWVLAVAGLSVLAVLWLAGRLLRGIFGAPVAVRRRLRESRQQRGLNALALALTAEATEDTKAALIHARKAGKLLADPRLTGPVLARSLTRSGKRDEAREYFQQLSEDRPTEAVGVHGLLHDAQSHGDVGAALEQARRAVALTPRNRRALAALFELQARTGDWAGSRATLRTQARLRILTKAEIQRREAVIHAAEALTEQDAGNTAGARRVAISATELDPGLASAAVLAARLLDADGDHRQARDILRAAWRQQPVPEIASAWAALDPGEEPQQRRRHFARLLDANPAHPESRLLAAEMAASEGDWVAARTALGAMPETDPGVRICAVMAALEKLGNGDETAARDWLARALRAPRGPGWGCGNCRTPQEGWAVFCPDCQAFDSIRFGDFGAGSHSILPGGLPLGMQVTPLPELAGAPPETASSQAAATPPTEDADSESAATEPDVTIVRPDA